MDKPRYTPEEFVAEIRRLESWADGDNEKFHDATDKLMERMLIDIGYSEGVALLRTSHERGLARWYA